MYEVCVFNKYGTNIGVVFESESRRECEQYIRDMYELCGIDVDLRIVPED